MWNQFSLPKRGILLFTLCHLTLSLRVGAQESFPDRESFAAHPRELEQVPLSAFEFGEEFADDLELEVWAQSPLIFSPVAMDVDPLGRLWVTEGIDYSVPKRVESGQSIVVLSDTDGDGTADHSQVFVTEKDARHAPLGIAVFDNKIVLSATPSMTVYTDVDRNAVFDPEIDKREVFLTGFQNKRHDHSLHAVVGSPSGQWYFSYGNCGADIETVDGRHFLSACYYGHSEAIGKPSSDGHVYVGGVAMRINPDGTGLTPVGHNLRNTHDMFVTSMGDVLHSDNDDPAHARSSWLMEYGNMGYADLRDGSRSWEEVSKSWDEPQGWNRDLRFSKSHWRENYPGAVPPGSVYGAGSPTGNVFIEGNEWGEEHRGLYLVCDMVRKEVMACRPSIRSGEAEVTMGKHRPFLKLRTGSEGEHFLPTDVVLGTDGALYLSDFYNDTSRRTNQVSGTIYRIRPRDKDGEKSAGPVIDWDTSEGLLEALKNPAVNVRAEAVTRLKKRGDSVASMLEDYFASESQPYLKARVPWVLAQLGDRGREYVRGLLNAEDFQLRLVAFRALRFAAPEEVLPMAGVLYRDPSPAVRREVALALRDVALEDCREMIDALVDGYDGENRWYLEALGIASTKKEAEVYREVIRPKFALTPPEKWNAAAKNLAWRFHTPEAVEDLHRVIVAQKPDLEAFRHWVMAYASFRTDAQRANHRKRLEELASLPAFSGPDFQITVEEILARDLNDLQGEFLEAHFLVPKAFGARTTVSEVGVIAGLEGDEDRGKVKAQVCLACHRVEGAGIAFGPNLTHWGQERTVEEIVTALVEPSAHLAHGYDKPVRLTAGRGKYVAEGLLSNFSWHAGSLKIKLYGGETKKILFRQSGARVDNLKDHSWMPPASEMGLSDQDVRDIAEYLRTLGN